MTFKLLTRLCIFHNGCFSGLKKGQFTPAGRTHTQRLDFERDKSHTGLSIQSEATNTVSGPTTPSLEEGSVKPLDLRKRAR